MIDCGWSFLMGFFDFLNGVAPYSENPASVARLNSRHYHLIEPFQEEINGARVFDIASHDGRWAYAFSGAGAARVTGVEARPELIERFDDFPDAELKQRVSLRHNDLFVELDSEASKGEIYDVVSVFGILYHIMDHFRLLKAVRALGPSLVIVDSEFMDRPGSVIQLSREKTDNDLNAAPQFESQEAAVVGYPSFKAMELMAEVLDFDLEWVDWGWYPDRLRKSVHDYYRTGGTGMRRGTCTLRPRKK
jgi:SAM-dependent methyltransferase